MDGALGISHGKLRAKRVPGAVKSDEMGDNKVLGHSLRRSQDGPAMSPPSIAR